MSLSKLNENPIATITFKYKTAQRRFEEGTIWDRLKQESPVYNGDTIRTADYSEATLHFIDGNEMSLTDNTMTQVFLNEDKSLRALLSGGSIMIDTSNADPDSAGVTLSYNGMEVQLENGTSINVTGSESQDFSVQVFNGTALVKNADGKVNNVSEGDSLTLSQTGTPKATLQVTNPRPNAKIINHSKDPYNVLLQWNLTGTDETFNYIVEISNDAGFKNIETSVDLKTAKSYNALLANGTSYYRIICKDLNNNERAQVKGKVQVIESMIPRLIAPVYDYQFNYRKQLPAVRFLWSQSKYATSYELIISDNPNFVNPKIIQRTALPSSIINTLSTGKWYWRVTPFYTINNLGLDGTSETGYFEIYQQGNLTTPTLVFPQENAFVNTKTASKNVNYSWKLDRECVNYNIIIADNKDLKNPVASYTTDVNYYPVNPSKIGLTNGTWYWGVCGIDKEGNRSDYSEPRSFYAIDGEVIQRTVYPPDQYSIAQGLLGDTRFTWKSNLQFDKRIEFSTTPDFSKIVYRQKVRDTTLSGLSLPTGTYYWRIVSSAPDRDIASPSKAFNVLGPLDAPVCIAPDVNKRALVRPFTPFDFSWTNVDGADYYKLTIKNPRTDEVLFEKNLIESTKYPVNMESIAEGFYKWTIQSFSYETELSTRRTGKIAEANFELKKIHPVELVNPEDNVVMDGVKAILEPTTVTWASRDEVSKSEFVLIRKDVKPPQVITRQSTPPRTIRLPRLHSGTYTWTVNAESIDGFDLSPAEPRNFKITPVPPLDSATKLVPENRKKFDVEYFRTNKQLNFSWAPVKDATHYIFRLYKRNGETLVEKKIKETKFTFSDIKMLERGNFTWSVEAIRCIEDGTTLQESTPTKNIFIVDLPKLNSTKLKSGVMYGK